MISAFHTVGILRRRECGYLQGVRPRWCCALPPPPPRPPPSQLQKKGGCEYANFRFTGGRRYANLFFTDPWGYLPLKGGAPDKRTLPK